ncbi:MAG: hypothetical protein M8364_18460 [Methylobacter sp.]|uniref:hypothetical protein n=1 Tax=Methylobacter sp. TaxID=2051955 RepID=UPI002585D6DA|nr:hypothetical protein [Methylobacter sp.]MCL7422877.1 hypothetical protein [Methylobacter sp.]
MQSIIDTIVNYYNAFIAYLVNVFDSLKAYLIDLPILIFEKVLEAVIWLLAWASSQCAACSSLPANLQAAWNAIAASNIGPTVLYCLHRSGIVDAMQILASGMLIWSLFKVIGFIKAVL